MNNNLIIVFYVEKILLEKYDFHNLESFEKCIYSKLESAIEYFVNRPKEILEDNPNNEFLLETFFQRKRKEKQFKSSISIELVENKEFSILFNYNKFINSDEKIDILKLQQIKNNDFNKYAIELTEYINWTNEIIKFFKLFIYEDNMNFLMSNNINKLPYNKLKATLIIKHLKTKIINF